MLKTRVAIGYCALPLEAGAGPYAKICEHFENFRPAPQAAPVLRAQLAEVRRLESDAQQRGWDSETRRHADTAQRLDRHLQRLAPRPDP